MQKKVSELLKLCYGFVDENYHEIFTNDKFFIVSNRGTFPFICLIGSLNIFLTKLGKLTYSSSAQERFNYIEKYLKALLDGLINLSENEKETQLLIRGAGAEISWLRLFQIIINETYPEYSPSELIDWKERHDKELQQKARVYVEDIERYMKTTIIENLKKIYSNDWELEIGAIQRKCLDRAQSQKEKEYKETKEYKNHHWTEMFEINDYKEIIKKYWTKKDENNTIESFSSLFAIDIGLGFNGKDDQTKWISKLSTFRNQLAHLGSKNKGLNEKEVLLLEDIHSKLYH